MAHSLHELPLEKKVGQLFFIGIPGPGFDEETRVLLDDVSPGGVCLFARNIREAKQTRELLDSLTQYLGNPLLSIDQEGGLVDRLRRLMTPLPAASKMRDAADARRLGNIVAEALNILGFNMDFAPVVDVIDGGRANHPNGLFSREFGRSREGVVALASAFIEGLKTRRILNCLKHFPGLGAARVDSHEVLPEVAISQEEFDEIDLYPYRQLLAKADSVMVGHQAYRALSLQETDQNGRLLPASLSRNVVTDLLRKGLGYDGLAISDDLEMGAVIKNYGMGEACKMAIDAGCDMLAICADPQAIRTGYNAVLAASRSGEISAGRIELSLERIGSLKGSITPPGVFNESRITELSDDIATFNGELTSWSAT